MALILQSTFLSHAFLFALISFLFYFYFIFVFFILPQSKPFFPSLNPRRQFISASLLPLTEPSSQTQPLLFFLWVNPYRTHSSLPDQTQKPSLESHILISKPEIHGRGLGFHLGQTEAPWVRLPFRFCFGLGILWILYCCSVLPDLILELKALPKFRTPKPPLTSARRHFELWRTSPRLISKSLLSGTPYFFFFWFLILFL